MKVNICGIPHEVVEIKDSFNVDCHLGQIDYKDLKIKINADMPQIAKDETLCHEMLHGMLIHLGYNDLANDEQFVQALGNAIYQGFAVKENNCLSDAYELGRADREKEICDFLKEISNGNDVNEKLLNLIKEQKDE